MRELALFNLGIDSKLRGCDFVRLAVRDVCHGGTVVSRAIVVQQKTQDDPLKIFKKAVDNVKPTLEVKSRRVGGANYQVPVEVPSRRARTLALRWLVTYSRDRREKNFDEKLAKSQLRQGIPQHRVRVLAILTTFGRHGFSRCAGGAGPASTRRPPPGCAAPCRAWRTARRCSSHWPWPRIPAPGPLRCYRPRRPRSGLRPA